MLYFAYGSKMDFRELRAHCPSAQFVAVGKLPNHRLSFTDSSEAHGCGIADAVPEHGESIWGVVYDIAEIEFGRLDQSEGYLPGRPASENDCVREQRHVCRDGHAHDVILAWLYLGARRSHLGAPNSAYKGLMVDGARFWHLPEAYVERLQTMDAV